MRAYASLEKEQKFVKESQLAHRRMGRIEAMEESGGHFLQKG